MSLMASSTDEPSKIIGDANKDFININIEEEQESETLDYNDELKPDRHLSAGVFPSIFDDPLCAPLWALGGLLSLPWAAQGPK